MANPDPKDRTAPAAQDDLLGEEAGNTGKMDGLTDEVGADGTPRDRGQASSTGSGQAPSTRSGQPGGEARPGKDENQAGFVKDKDKRSSP